MSISRIKHPVLYLVNIERHRWQRCLKNIVSQQKMAKKNKNAVVPFKVFSHKSVLIRRLGNSDLRLQYQKIKNLQLAAASLDGVVIRPGETFSFWQLIGNPSSRRGFVNGMLLSQGEVIKGVGGGLCQLANLLYWMILHTPLTVVERYRHSFDAFPDSGRVLPFASGATVFYNYVDLQFRNDTEQVFKLHIWLDDEFLHGEFFSTQRPTKGYHVVERDHRFFRRPDSDKVFRENKLFQQTIDVASGNLLSEKLVTENLAEVKYPVVEEF